MVGQCRSGVDSRSIQSVDSDAVKEENEPGTEASPNWAQLHLWQIQSVRDVLVVAGLFGLFLLGERLSIVTVPLTLALLFAYLLEPVVLRLSRLRWFGRRGATSAVLVLGTLVVVIPVTLASALAVVQGARFAETLAQRTGAVLRSVETPEDAALRDAVGSGAWGSIRDFVVEVKYEAQAQRGEDPDLERRPEGRAAALLGVDPRDAARLLNFALEWTRDNAAEIGKKALSGGRNAVDVGKGAVFAALTTLTTIGKLVFGAFLTAFFFYFFSSAWKDFEDFTKRLMPLENRARVVDILRKMGLAISGFVRGRVTVAFVLAIFYSVGFLLIGVPMPLILGPAIAVLSIVPYAALLGFPFVIVFLWLEPHEGIRGATWWVLVAPIVVYQIGQLADDYILTPVIQGEATGLDTPVILFASIAGGALFGFFGLLVAIPLAACIRILILEVFWPRMRAWVEGRASDILPLDEA